MIDSKTSISGWKMFAATSMGQAASRLALAT
jgi:hypothetical protein